MANNTQGQYDALIRDFEKANLDDIRNAQSREDFDIIEENFRGVLIGLDSKDNSPNGPKAQALAALGRRHPEWDWAVGETPEP